MPGRDWCKNTQGLSVPWGTNCSGHRLERPSKWMMGGVLLFLRALSLLPEVSQQFQQGDSSPSVFLQCRKREKHQVPALIPRRLEDNYFPINPCVFTLSLSV